MVTHIENRGSAGLKNAITISICVSILLLLVKFSAYALTGSAAILSDAAESIVNVIASIFAFISLKIAMKPPDEEHPYGHGKAEYFSAAFEGGAIIVAAFWIIYKAVAELIHGPTFHKLDVGIWLIVFSLFANLILGLFLVRRGKTSHNLILEADGKHIMTDVVTSAGIVAGLVLMYFSNWFWLDPVIAIIMAVIIIRTGYLLLKKASTGMMDAKCPEDDIVIKEIFDSGQFEEICGYHKLRHRHSGGLHFVDFHLIFPKDTTVAKAHEVATDIEMIIAKALGTAGVMAHIEPCKDEGCAKCRRSVTPHSSPL